MDEKKIEKWKDKLPKPPKHTQTGEFKWDSEREKNRSNNVWGKRAKQ